MSEADMAGRPEGLDLAADPANDSATAAGYRVLARKYRPATFDDLIGQEAMVRTISNAFETGRIPQAWILTGVRGVGKTTTARILARGLNYELPDGSVDRADHQDAGARHQLPGDHGKPARRRAGDGRRLPQRRRRHPPDQRCRALCAGERALQGLHPGRGAHALEPGLQRAARRPSKSRRPTPSSCSRRPTSARCRSPCCRAASASTCAASRPGSWSPISKAFSPRRG